MYDGKEGAHADDQALLLAGRVVPAFLAQHVLADIQSTLSDARSLPEWPKVYQREHSEAV